MMPGACDIYGKCSGSGEIAVTDGLGDLEAEWLKLGAAEYYEARERSADVTREDALPNEAAMELRVLGQQYRLLHGP